MTNVINSLLATLSKIVDVDDNRTNDSGADNEYWNIGFRCATGRIFYAALQSVKTSQKREDDLRAELGLMMETDPDAQNKKTGYTLERLEEAQKITSAMIAVNADFEKLHFDLVGDDFDVDQYESTFPQNRKSKKKVDGARLKAALLYRDTEDEVMAQEAEAEEDAKQEAHENG
jgi:hypothetical protein